MPEDQNIEYKRTWRDEYLKWVCGFANAKRGTLFIGINDEGKPTGIENYDELLEQLPNKLRDLLGVYATIDLHKKDGISYLEISVPHYEVPISYRGKYYVRSGSTLQELKGVALNEFLLEKAGKSWDSIRDETFSFEDINEDTIERFKVLAEDRLPAIRSENKIQVILDKLNLRENRTIRRAALLLFGNGVQRYFLQARIKIGRFASDADIITSDVVEGNLFQQLDEAMDILRTKYLESPITYEGMHRREKLEIPYEALREALINALIHRTYATSSTIQIKVTDQTVEIMNEGALPNGMKPDDLKKTHLSIPRNRLLADVFYKSGLIESWGRGTLKITEACVQAGLPEPVFNVNEHLFSITFQRTGNRKADVTENVIENVTENQVEKRQQRIISILKDNTSMTTTQLAEQLEVSRRTIARDINHLKSKGKLLRKGTDKKGNG